MAFHRTFAHIINTILCHFQPAYLDLEMMELACLYTQLVNNRSQFKTMKEIFIYVLLVIVLTPLLRLFNLQTNKYSFPHLSTYESFVAFQGNPDNHTSLPLYERIYFLSEGSPMEYENIDTIRLIRQHSEIPEQFGNYKSIQLRKGTLGVENMYKFINKVVLLPSTSGQCLGSLQNRRNGVSFCKINVTITYLIESMRKSQQGLDNEGLVAAQNDQQLIEEQVVLDVKQQQKEEMVVAVGEQIDQSLINNEKTVQKQETIQLKDDIEPTVASQLKDNSSSSELPIQTSQQLQITHLQQQPLKGIQPTSEITNQQNQTSPSIQRPQNHSERINQTPTNHHQDHTNIDIDRTIKQKQSKINDQIMQNAEIKEEPINISQIDQINQIKQAIPVQHEQIQEESQQQQPEIQERSQQVQPQKIEQTNGQNKTTIQVVHDQTLDQNGSSVEQEKQDTSINTLQEKNQSIYGQIQQVKGQIIGEQLQQQRQQSEEDVVEEIDAESQGQRGSESNYNEEVNEMKTKVTLDHDSFHDFSSIIQYILPLAAENAQIDYNTSYTDNAEAKRQSDQKDKSNELYKLFFRNISLPEPQAKLNPKILGDAMEMGFRLNQ